MNQTDEKPDLEVVDSGAAGWEWPGWLAPVLIGLLILVAFLPPLTDKAFLGVGDRFMLVENSEYRGLGADHLMWALRQNSAKVDLQYHPLVWWSFGLDWVLWGGDARGFHLTNMVLHAFAAVFLYLIAGRLFTAASEGRPSAPGPGRVAVRLGALLAALLFAVHPLRAESVAWATERGDVLGGFFFLAGIWCYLRYRDLAVPLTEDEPPVYKQGRPRFWMTVSVLLAVCAVLSKATAICIPLVLVILDIYPLRISAKQVKGLWLDRAPFIVVAAIGAMLGLQALGETPLPGPESMPVRLLQALSGSLVLLQKMVWPVGLNPLYELRADAGLNTGLLAGGGVAVLLTAVLLVVRKRWPAGLAAWLCYLAMLLPVAGLVRIGVPAEADRHSYLAGMAWAVLLGGMLWALARRAEPGAGITARGWVGTAVAALLVLTLTGLTYGQSKVWSNDKSLWTQVVSARPNNWRGHAELGLVLRRERDLNASEACYLEAIRLKPDAWEVHNNLGQVLSLMGRLDDALEHFRLAKEGNPRSPAPRQNLATTLYMLGRVDEAGEEIAELLKRLPAESPEDSPELKRLRARAYNDFGAVCYQQGKYDEAIESYRRALAMFPVYPVAHQGLGDAWLAKGEVEQAMAHYEEVLRLNPNDESVRKRLMELRAGREQAAASATTAPAGPDAEAAAEARKQMAEAMTRLREELEKDSSNATAHYEMGLLLGRMGQFEQSIDHFSEAIRLKPDLAAAYYYQATVYAKTNRLAEAVGTARAGLAQTPEDVRLLGLLAHLLISSSDPEQADPAEGLELAERANQLEADNPSLLEVLARAYAANGRMGEAADVLGKAKALAEAQKNAFQVDRLSRLQEAYEQQRRGGG
jgi:tetratricopeptide (TPR) repeat protein